MKLPRGRLLLLALATASLAGTIAPGCGGGGSSSGATVPGGPTVTGMVIDYTEEPARAVPLQVLSGGPGGQTRIDGFFAVGPVTPGAHVLRIGDSVTTPTLLVPFTGTDTASPLDRPIYLPALSSGIGATLPSGTATSTTISGDELPGVSLTLASGTAVSLPTGANEVRVLAVSPSRLPVALPAFLTPRVAYLVEPHGATFSPAATLTIPRLDPLAAGPFDAYEVSTTTGEWQLLRSDVAVVGTDAMVVDVPRGTMIAVVPRAAPARVTVTGRLVAGTQPLEGFRACCWNRTSAPTGPDGRFTIDDVPTSYGLFYVRAYPARPAVDFAPAVTQVTASAATIGDLTVTARAPDALRPFVKATSPASGQTGVGPEVQVVVTFSEPIDRSLAEPFTLVGRTGKVAGRVNFDNGFTVRFIPTQQLETSQRYTIVVDDAVTDLAGNPVDDADLTIPFETRGGAPATPPTDTLAFGLAPLTAARGDTVSVLGRNFTGGTQVSFGGTTGLVLAETSDEVRVIVPDFQPAGDVTLSLSAGGQAIGALRPLVLDLRAQVATIYSGATGDVRLVALDRAQPSPVIIVDGDNVGGAQVTIDGLSIAAVDSTVPVGSANVATGRALTITTPAPATLLTGPVVLRGANGRPAVTYRFLLVRE